MLQCNNQMFNILLITMLVGIIHNFLLISKNREYKLLCTGEKNFLIESIIVNDKLRGALEIGPVSKTPIIIQ